MMNFLGINPCIDDQEEGFLFLSSFLTTNYMESWANIWQGDITIRPQEVGIPDASTPVGLTVIKDAKGQLWDSVSYFWGESWISNRMVYRRGMVVH